MLSDLWLSSMRPVWVRLAVVVPVTLADEVAVPIPEPETKQVLIKVIVIQIPWKFCITICGANHTGEAHLK